MDLIDSNLYRRRLKVIVSYDMTKPKNELF